MFTRSIFKLNFILLITSSVGLYCTHSARADGRIFAQLKQPIGLATDSAGNLIVQSDRVWSLLLTKFAPTGAILGQVPVGNIDPSSFSGHMARIPNTNYMLLMSANGIMYSIDPKNLRTGEFLDLTWVYYKTASHVYDPLLGTFASLSLGAPTWGDIAMTWENAHLLYIYVSATTGAAGGFPFVLRLGIDFNTNRYQATVVAATTTATTAGSLNQPRGIAVNKDGWVLTGFPGPTLVDSLVAFHTSFPEKTSSGNLFPHFILPNARTGSGLQDLASVGMTSDTAGNFYVATGPVGTTLCGLRASSAIVTISRNPAAPNPRCLFAPGGLWGQYDLTLSPDDATIYFEVNNYIVRMTNPLHH